MTIDEQSKKKMLSYRWAIFGVLAVAYFFVYFHRTTGGAISQTLQDAFGCVALVAMAPIIAIEIMGLSYKIRSEQNIRRFVAVKEEFIRDPYRPKKRPAPKSAAAPVKAGSDEPVQMEMKL